MIPFLIIDIYFASLISSRGDSILPYGKLEAEFDNLRFYVNTSPNASQSKSFEELPNVFLQIFSKRSFPPTDIFSVSMFVTLDFWNQLCFVSNLLTGRESLDMFHIACFSEFAPDVSRSGRVY